MTTSKRGSQRSELTLQLKTYQMRLRRLYIDENHIHTEIDRVMRKIDHVEKALDKEIA
jgi:hypothetical protein